MAKMKVAQVPKPGGDFEIVEREIPQPGPGEVRIRVQACGICHSDSLTKEGQWPGLTYPRVPGHEVAGVIDEAGAGVADWKKGQKVGVGWHGGQCGRCLACRRGDFANCSNGKVPGISYDGGYQQFMIAPVEALRGFRSRSTRRKPARCCARGSRRSTPCATAAPCPRTSWRFKGSAASGTSAFSSRGSSATRSRRSARAGERRPRHEAGRQRVHRQRGHERGGGAAKARRRRVILATAPSSKAMSSLIDGLGANGKMVVVGATPEPIEVSPIQLIMGRKSIQGWYCGIATDSEDTLRFAELTGVRPMIEKYPLERAGEAYARMMSGKAEFRVVLTM